MSQSGATSLRVQGTKLKLTSSSSAHTSKWTSAQIYMIHISSNLLTAKFSNNSTWYSLRLKNNYRKTIFFNAEPYQIGSIMKAIIRSSVPYKRKKIEIFSGIFALKFCEFWHFFSRQKPALLFPAQNHRQPRFTAPHSGMSQKSRRKVAEIRRRTLFFFFLEIT